MSNHHLRNAALSLKAKGLMLEKTGYITRSRERTEHGQLCGTEYTIHEQPPGEKTPNDEIEPPTAGSPVLGLPTLDNPTQANPTLGNPTQINKERKATKEEKNTDGVNTDSIPFHSPREENKERKETETTNTPEVAIYREYVIKNLDYEIMVERYPYDRQHIDGIVDLILEILCTARKTIRIAGDDYPAELVKGKFMKLDGVHLEFVLDCMKKNTTAIRNIKKYMLAVLFNAPSTIDSYYTALVAHDMASYK